LRRFGGPPDDKGKLLAPPRVGFRGSSVPAALSADGKTLAYNLDGLETVLYDVASGKRLGSLQEGPARGTIGLALGLDFSPDGQHLAVLELSGSIKVWDWAKAKEVRKFGKSQPKGAFFAAAAVIAYSPDGKRLAVLQQDFQQGMPAFSLKLFDPSTGQEVRAIPLAKDTPGTAGPAVFSPDGSKLAFVDADGAIKVVETDTGKEVSRMMQGPKDAPGRRNLPPA